MIKAGMSRQPVRLNVYDMYWVNEYVANVGIGVYHSGIEVYGVEYAYGGHPFPFSGIFENDPKCSEELGENFKFRESMLLGYTDFTVGDVRHLVSMLGHEYKGDRYHLITNNCNHFTGALAKTLCGAELPSWVNRLASISGSIPFLERCLPQEWLTPVALQQRLEERRRASLEANADSSTSPSSTTGARLAGGGGETATTSGGSGGNGFRWPSFSSLSSPSVGGNGGGLASPPFRNGGGTSTSAGGAGGGSPSAVSLTRSLWSQLTASASNTSLHNGSVSSSPPPPSSANVAPSVSSRAAPGIPSPR